jgi:hypothetical protein
MRGRALLHMKRISATGVAARKFQRKRRWKDSSPIPGWQPPEVLQPQTHAGGRPHAVDFARREDDREHSYLTIEHQQKSSGARAGFSGLEGI